MLPVGIIGGGDQLEIIRGDAYFQSYICHLPRSDDRAGLTGRLDCLDGMLFPSICDVIRNLSGMWQLLLPGQATSRYLDVPQNFDAGVGGAFYGRELADAAARPRAASPAAPVTDDDLRAVDRRLQREPPRWSASCTRCARSEPVAASPTAELYLVLRAGSVLPVEEHTALRARLPRPRAASRRRARSATTRAWCVTGAFCEQPPLGADQDARARRLLHRGRRLRCSACAGSPATCRPTGDPLEALVARVPRPHARRPPRRATIADERQGRSAWSSRCARTRRRGRDLLRRRASAIRRCSTSRCCEAALDAPASRTPRSSTPRTPASSRSSASRPAPSRIRSSCGARAMSDRPRPQRTARPRRRTQHVAPEGDDRGPLRTARRRRPTTGREGRLHLRPRQPDRAAAVASTSLPVLPGDQRAAVRHARKRSAEYIAEAEKRRPLRGRLHLRQVRHRHAAGRATSARPASALPEPDLLLLSYTGCFTFMKWFELLREEYDCPVAMLHVPYQARRRRSTRRMRDYVVRAARDEGDPDARAGHRPQLRRGPPARALRALARRPRTTWSWVLRVREAPAVADRRLLRRRLLHRADLHRVPRHRRSASTTTASCARRSRSACAPALGPDHARGRRWTSERYRLVVEGPPNWTSFREFWKMFYDEGAVVVASTYTKVGGLYDRGFRHDPDRPLETLADYCLGCYTNLNLPARVDLLARYVARVPGRRLPRQLGQELQLASRAGQLLMLREVEKRTGVPGGFIESDLVDPRYFSAANIKNRIESYLQMLDAEAPARAPRRRACHALLRRHRPRLDHHQGGGARRGRARPRPRHHQHAVNYDVAVRRSRAARRSSTRASRSCAGALERAGTLHARARRPSSAQLERALPRASSTSRSSRASRTVLRAARRRAALGADRRARSPPRSTEHRRRHAAPRRAERSSRRARRARATSSATSPAAATSRSPRSAAGRGGVALRRAARRLRQGDPRGREPRPRRRSGVRTCAARSTARSARCADGRALGRRGPRADRGALRPSSRRPASVGTGYGRARLPFPKEQIRSEILCHGLGAHAMFPGTRTVLDIGGQDTKAIQVDDAGHRHQLPDERPLRRRLRPLPRLHRRRDEPRPARARAAGACRRTQRGAASTRTCTVFAGAELRERLSLGREARGHPGRPAPRDHPARDVAARALGRRARTSSPSPAAWRKNPAAVAALRELVRENYGERDDQHLARLDLHRRARRGAVRLRAAVEAGARRRRRGHDPSPPGIDVGSGAVKAVAGPRADGDAATDCSRSARERIRRRDPREVVARGFRRGAAPRPALEPRRLAYVATTGEGELVAFRTGHFYGMTTHARGALFLEPEARAVLDVGALHARGDRAWTSAARCSATA